jgi:hypothetical protein
MARCLLPGADNAAAVVALGDSELAQRFESVTETFGRPLTASFRGTMRYSVGRRNVPFLSGKSRQHQFRRSPTSPLGQKGCDAVVRF